MANRTTRALIYLDASRVAAPTPARRHPTLIGIRNIRGIKKCGLTRTRQKFRHRYTLTPANRRGRITRENQSGLILASKTGPILESASGRPAQFKLAGSSIASGDPDHWALPIHDLST